LKKVSEFQYARVETEGGQVLGGGVREIAGRLVPRGQVEAGCGVGRVFGHPALEERQRGLARRVVAGDGLSARPVADGGGDERHEGRSEH